MLVGKQHCTSLQCHLKVTSVDIISQARRNFESISTREVEADPLEIPKICIHDGLMSVIYQERSIKFNF